MEHVFDFKPRRVHSAGVSCNRTCSKRGHLRCRDIGLPDV